MAARTLGTALAAFLALLCCAQADWLFLSPGWSFSEDLSFPNSASSSSLNSYTDIAPFSIFLPIVNSTRFTAGLSKGFSLGFLSLFDSNVSSPSQIYLCICLGVHKSGPSGRPFLVPVWTLDPESGPLQQQAGGQWGFVKLQMVDDDEQLQLEDGNGTVVWNQSNVGSMEMQDNGTLVLNDRQNRTIWESYKHPSDTLLRGQQLRFEYGHQLKSRNQMYKAVMKPGGIQFSLVQPALVYWIFAANASVNSYFQKMVESGLPLDVNAPINLTAAMAAAVGNCEENNDYYAELDAGDQGLEVRGTCESTSQFFTEYRGSDLVRLDDDGNMRGYNLSQSASSSYIFTPTIEESRPCYAPNVCGAYGICTTESNSVQHSCRCPSDEDNKSLDGAFRPIEASNPSQGCERTTILECKADPSSQAAQLVEIKSVASIAMLFLFELTWKENSMSLADCQASCASECSCTGFLYHTKSSFCLKLEDITGLSNLSFISLNSSDEHLAYLKIQPNMEPKPSPSDAKKRRVILIVAMVLLVVFCTALGAIVYRKLKQRADPAVEIAEQQLLGVMPTLPIRFSYEELSRMTSGFSTRLGVGGFGSVYAGIHPDGGTRVAVKKLEALSHGQKQFLAEIATIGSIRHVNIVHLYGFCLEKQHRLLVYEYMENGSLDKWLFSKQKEPQSPVMSWEKRFWVALGMARGLAFLHEECPKPILHFDVKPENILLDADFNAKLADFGLAKLLAHGESSAQTVMRGTPGYIAPEWLTHSVVSKKCDVYSFGMVLLELVSGKRNVESQLYSSERYFPKWAAEKSREGKVGELLDERLQYSTSCEARAGVQNTILEQVTRVVGVALMCISGRPDMRPSMAGACSMLEGSVALPNFIAVPGMDVEAPAFGVSFTAASSASTTQGTASSSSIVDSR